MDDPEKFERLRNRFCPKQVADKLCWNSLKSFLGKKSGNPNFITHAAAYTLAVQKGGAKFKIEKDFVKQKWPIIMNTQFIDMF
jgi:hypothetical protein